MYFYFHNFKIAKKLLWERVGNFSRKSKYSNLQTLRNAERNFRDI